MSRTDRLSFQIFALEDGLLGFTKIELQSASRTINVLRSPARFDLGSSLKQNRLMFGDGRGRVPDGVSVKADDVVVVSMSLQRLNDTDIEETFKVVVEVVRHPLVITNRHRYQRELDSSDESERHEATLGEFCVGEKCNERHNTKNGSGASTLVITLSVLLVAAVLIIIVGAVIYKIRRSKAADSDAS